MGRRRKSLENSELCYGDCIATSTGNLVGAGYAPNPGIALSASIAFRPHRLGTEYSLLCSRYFSVLQTAPKTFAATDGQPTLPACFGPETNVTIQPTRS